MISFYFDHNLEASIHAGLVAFGIDAVTAYEDHTHAWDDPRISLVRFRSNASS